MQHNFATNQPAADGGATTTPSYATVASRSSEASKRHQEKPTNKPERHEVPATNWLTYSIHTKMDKCCWFGRAGQSTMGRGVQVEDGAPMDWDTSFPILSSSRQTSEAEETRVQPAKDLKIPAAITITNGTQMKGMEEDKEGKGLKAKKSDVEEKKKEEENHMEGKEEENGSKKTTKDEDNGKKGQKEQDMDKESGDRGRKENDNGYGIGMDKELEAKKYGVNEDMEKYKNGEVFKKANVMDDVKRRMEKDLANGCDHRDIGYGTGEDLNTKKDKKDKQRNGQKEREYETDKDLVIKNKRKMWRKRAQGGGETVGTSENGEENEKETNQERNKKLRFGRTVDVRVLQKEDGNENTLKTVLTDVVGEGVARLTKPLPSSPRRAECLKDYSMIDPASPTTTDAEKMVIDANASFEYWPAPEENDTIQSVTIDSNVFPSNNSSFYDDRSDTYSNDDLANMIQKERFDPLSYYRITIQFQPEAQQSLMTNMEWMRNNNRQNRTERDYHLDGDAIYAALLKVLHESSTDKYAVGLPASLELPYDVDDTRVGVVRRADPDWILQPLHFRDHWILACVNPTTRAVIIYDSLSHKYNPKWKADVKKIVTQYCNMMLNTKCIVRWARKDYVLKQEDTVNCGVYVVIHARRFAQGRQKLVGRPDDGYDLDEERKDILILMMCLYQYILLNLDVSAPMQQYVPIDCTFERATRTSPRDLTRSLMRIKNSVAVITPKPRGARNKIVAPVATPQQSPVQSPSPQQSPPSNSSPILSSIQNQSPIVQHVNQPREAVKQRVIEKRKLRGHDTSDENAQKRRRMSRPGEVIDLSRSIPTSKNSQQVDQQSRRGNKRRSKEDLGEAGQVKKMRNENVTERRRGRRSEKVTRPIELDMEVDVSSPRRCHKRRRFQVMDDEDDDDDPLKKKKGDGRSGDNESIGSRQ